MIETGYNRDTIDKLIDRFIGYGKVLYSASTKEIMIVNWIKHNFINSKNTITHSINLWQVLLLAYRNELI